MNLDQTSLGLSGMLLIILCAIFFILGYILGKMNSLQNIGSQSNISKTILSKNNEKLKSISIDEKTVVTEIKTDGLEKKYTDIANSVESNDSVTSSIDKLKKLKR